MLRYIVRALQSVVDAGDLWAHAIAFGVQLGFFFLLRNGEYCAQDATNYYSYIIRRHHITFYRNGLVCEWNQKPDEVAVWIPGSKTDQQHEGSYRSHYCSGSDLCIVTALVNWFSVTVDRISPSSPLMTVPFAENRTAILTRSAIADALKAAAVAGGSSPADVSTHSLRSGAATAMLHFGATGDSIAIAGRWRSGCFREFTRWSRLLMQGVSHDMASVIT